MLGWGRVGMGAVPLFEFFAMGIVFDAADHEVCEVAVFVGKDID